MKKLLLILFVGMSFYGSAIGYVSSPFEDSQSHCSTQINEYFFCYFGPDYYNSVSSTVLRYVNDNLWGIDHSIEDIEHFRDSFIILGEKTDKYLSRYKGEEYTLLHYTKHLINDYIDHFERVIDVRKKVGYSLPGFYGSHLGYMSRYDSYRRCTPKIENNSFLRYVFFDCTSLFERLQEDEKNEFFHIGPITNYSSRFIKPIEFSKPMLGIEDLYEELIPNYKEIVLSVFSGEILDISTNTRAENIELRNICYISEIRKENLGGYTGTLYEIKGTHRKYPDQLEECRKNVSDYKFVFLPDDYKQYGILLNFGGGQVAFSTLEIINY